MNILGHMTVLPDVPARIARLGDISNNLYWTWRPDARRLFRRLDPELWERIGHSPVETLRDIAQEKLEAAAQNPEYLALYDEVVGAVRRVYEAH